MSFDRVAPHYHWLESVVFGQQLQEARTAFLNEIASPRRVLVVGEGNGRFLAQFVRLYPEAAVDSIETSGRMIELAKRRVGRANVRHVRSDIREIVLRPNSYDLLVTHFFLDCFEEASLSFIITKLANSAAPHAQWLIADFCRPPKDWRHLRGRFLIALMYRFFRVVSGIEARQLVDYRPLLHLEGFGLGRKTLSPNEMIRTEVWERE